MPDNETGRWRLFSIELSQLTDRQRQLYEIMKNGTTNDTMHDKALDVAMNLKAMGRSDEDIARATGLSQEDIQQL